MNRMIDVQNMTKDYGHGKGVFDISFTVEKGEVMGFLGPNGAGKTTTIRQLMGFAKPDKGTVAVLSMDCFTKADQIHKRLGYLPGEIAFMDNMSGNEFMRFIAKMKGMKDLSYMEELKQTFELNASGKIKKMSKGMKQKIGIVCAFMQDPEILILDEPTSGLDPLMQNKFVELIQKEKEKGKTILMSSHIFEEIERTCDRTVIIREGRIAAVEDMEKLKSGKRKVVEFEFASEKDAQGFEKTMPGSVREKKLVVVKVKGHMDECIKAAAGYTVKDVNVKGQSLEELFMHYYGEGEGK